MKRLPGAIVTGLIFILAGAVHAQEIEVRVFQINDGTALDMINAQRQLASDGSLVIILDQGAENQTTISLGGIDANVFPEVFNVFDDQQVAVTSSQALQQQNIPVTIDAAGYEGRLAWVGNKSRFAMSGITALGFNVNGDGATVRAQDN